jgi:MFS family permease
MPRTRVGTNVRAYLELFNHPDARWPLLSSTLARLTQGMIVLALVYALRAGAYSYTAVGLVTAGHQIGVGLASPIQGRLADRFGQPQVLVPDAAAYLVGTASLAWFVGHAGSVPLLVALAVATGVFFPPIGACSRVLMSRLFPGGRMRETAFAVTSIAVELGFILGPLLAMAVAFTIGADWAVVLAGLAAAVGSVGYASTRGAREMPRGEPGAARAGALRSPGVRIMVVAFAAIAVAFGVFDVVVPAVAEFAGQPRAAAWLISSIAFGSLLGGLVYGARSWPGSIVTRLRVVSGVFTLGLLLIPFSTGSLPLFAVALFLGGVFLAPTTITAFQLIDDLAIRGTQTEAQSWTQSAVVLGVAIGTALTGASIDLGGPSAAFLGGAACVGLGALIINLGGEVLARPRRDDAVRVS